MSKKSKGQGRLRVFFAEFEGDDETIQEGLRAISSAVTKTFQPTAIVRYLPAEQPELNGEDIERVVEEMLDEEESSVSPSTSRPKSSVKRKYPTMSLVKELDLRPEGKNSLRDFIVEKNPASQEQKIAVAVYYLRRILEVDAVTPNHVYTCFKDVGFRPPNDMPQIIRNTANRKGWVDTANSSALEITTQGENFVEHDLPPTNGE